MNNRETVEFRPVPAATERGEDAKTGVDDIKVETFGGFGLVWTYRTDTYLLRSLQYFTYTWVNYNNLTVLPHWEP